MTKRNFSKNQKKWMISKAIMEVIEIFIIVAGIVTLKVSCSDPDTITTYGGPLYLLGMVLIIAGIVAMTATLSWKYKDSKFFKKAH